MQTNIEYKVLHLFAGIGGGAMGFQQAQASWKGLLGTFRTLCGIDVDPLACQDFEYLTGAPTICADLFERRDYIAFHGHEPLPGWKEVTPEDIRTATKGEYPDVVFLSAPCKGFSGLLPEKNAKSAKYQALNNLTVRGMWLTLEAFRDNLPAAILFENVPRIKTRGKKLLNTITGMLESYSYVIDKADHDCGEIGGLGQHRKRFLLIARNPAKMPSFIYKPEKHRVRSIGEVIGPLPLPDDPAMGPMHRLPRLQWKTWVRLALIPAGGDWRDLENINPEQYRLEYVPRGRGPFGVQDWDQPGATVIGSASIKGSNAVAVADPRLTPREGRHAAVYQVVRFDKPSPVVTGTRFGSGAPAIADPRGENFANSYRIAKWDEPSGTVTGGGAPSNGAITVADPRTGFKDSTHGAIYKVSPWDEAANTVTGANRPNNGAISIADPRVSCQSRPNLYGVADWDKPTGAVTGSVSVTSSNAVGAVADPRLGCKPRSGTMGVQAWDEPGKTVIGAGDIHAGAAAVADQRIPRDNETLDPPPLIIALDGTWHRPLTTLELAVIQSFPIIVNGQPLKLAGNSDARWREAIGNAVPPKAAKGMAEVALMALLMSREAAWELTEREIWVSPGKDGETDELPRIPS